MKHCGKCDRTLDLEHFYEYGRNKDGRASNCRDCYKRYRDQNLDTVARSKACSTYKITKEEYNALFVRAGNLCEICQRPQRSVRFKRLGIDHNHVTKKVRGVLCAQCNAALGKFDDDPVLLRRAASYLEDR